jgi:hypothetical protein
VHDYEYLPFGAPKTLSDSFDHENEAELEMSALANIVWWRRHAMTRDRSHAENKRQEFAVFVLNSNDSRSTVPHCVKMTKNWYWS